MKAERKTLWLTLGGLLGLAFGVSLAYWLWQEYEERGQPPKLDARRGLRLVLVLLQSARRILALLMGE